MRRGGAALLRQRGLPDTVEDLSLKFVLCAGLTVAVGFGLLILLLVASGGGSSSASRPFVVDGRALVAEATADESSDWWTPAGEL